MSYRGARGGAPGGGGGAHRLSASSSSSGVATNNSSTNSGRNRGGAPSPSGARGWASPAPQANGGAGGTPRQQQHYQHGNQNSSAAATITAFPSLGKATGPTTNSNSTDNDSQARMRDRTNFVIISLIGNTVTVKTRSGTEYVGILHSTTTEANELGVALTHAQQLNSDASIGPPIPSLVIKGPELDSIEASEVTLGEPVKVTPDGFRTDVEISARGGPDPFAEGRTLQKWSDDPGLSDLDSGLEIGAPTSDLVTSGNASKGGAWDQFAANEARFGIKSNYEETLYTTKLDRSGKDFKEREKRAEKLAAEIMASTSTNPHIAEERGHAAADDSGHNEEDKYGAVVRGPNAYVPPAARRAAEAAAAASAVAPKKEGKDALPKDSAVVVTDNVTSLGNPNSNSFLIEPVSGSRATPGIAIKVPTPTRGTEPSANAEAFNPSPVSSVGASVSAVNNEKLTSDFRHFVSSERQRILREKQNALAGAQAKAEREKQAKLAELKKWSSSFKLKTPMPEDVASVIHKSSAGEKPRDPSLAKSLSPTTAHAQIAGAPNSTGRFAGSGTGGTASVVTSPAGGAGAASLTKLSSKDTKTGTADKSSTNTQLAETKTMLSKMTIPKIPPFNSEKAKARQAAAAAAAKVATAAGNKDSMPIEGPATTSPLNNKSSVAFRMSAKASSFKPFNPAAAAFTPGGGSAAAIVNSTTAPAASSTAIKQQQLDSILTPPSAAAATAAVPTPAHPASAVSTATSMAVQAANPFFGTKVLKKSTHPIHIREEFNPFKPGKVAEAATITPTWPYTGKSYRHFFSTITSPLIAGQQAGQLGSGEDGTAHQGIVSMGGLMHPGTNMPSTSTSQHSAGAHHHVLHHSQPITHSGQMGIVSGQSSGIPLNVMVPGTPNAGNTAPPHAPSPYGIVYQPQPGGPGPYRFPQGQYVVQGGMPMAGPPVGGGGMPYGAGMPPQFVSGGGQQSGGVVHPHHLVQGGHQHHLHQQQQQGAGHPIHVQQMHFQGQGGVSGVVPAYQGMYSPQLGNMQAVPAQYLPMTAPPSGAGQQQQLGSSGGGASVPSGHVGSSTPRLGSSGSGPGSNPGGNVSTGPAGNSSSVGGSGGGKGPASLPQAPPPSAGGMYYPPAVQQPGGPPQFGNSPPPGPGGPGMSAGAGGQQHFVPQGLPHGQGGMAPRQQHYQPHHHPHQQQLQHHHGQQQGYSQQQQHHGGGVGGGGGHGYTGGPPPQHHHQQGQGTKSGDAGKAASKE